MQHSFPSPATLAGCFGGACRIVGLAAVLVASGGILGFAVSLHMAQVYERVTHVRAVAALPMVAMQRGFAGRNDL